MNKRNLIENIFGFMLIVFVLFLLSYASISHYIDNSYCDDLGYDTYQIVGNHFNCCNKKVIIEDNKYVEKVICVKGR